MLASDLVAYRERFGLRQEDLAAAMGLARRSLQDIELKGGEIAKRTELAFERAALSLAIERGDINLAPAAIRRDALALARLITG